MTKLVRATVLALLVGLLGWGTTTTASAGPVVRERATTTVRLTWSGYRGVHPGESLRRAAHHLHTRVLGAHQCGFSFLKKTGSPHVVIDDEPTRSGIVGEIAVDGEVGSPIVGPGGVRPGMTAADLRRLYGDRLHQRRNPTTGPPDFFVVGPHGYTAWIRLGYFVDGETYDATRVGDIGLSPNRHAALASFRESDC